jgi:hypothetical protein
VGERRFPAGSRAEQAKTAKKGYEEALRQEFFNF